MINRLLFRILCILLLTGCSIPPTNIVNEINIIQGVGYDLAANNRIKETIIIPIFKKDKSSSTEINTSFGQASKEIRANLNTESRYPLVSGQVRLALYGRDLAKKGIIDMVDTLNRDPSIGSLVQMAFVDGDATDLLKIDKYKTENISIYLQEMLKQNMEFGQLPHTDLHTFLFQYFQVGQDPYLPLIKKVNNHIKINGLALFKDDRFITSLPMEDLVIFKGLVGSYKHGLQKFILGNGDRIVLEILHSKAKYKVNIVNGKPKYRIYLNVKTNLQEFHSPKQQRVPIQKRKIQKQVEKIFEKNTLKMITQFKSHQVDPLGLGAKYKEHYRGFNEKQWKQFYPQIEVLVKAKVEIQKTGIVE